MPILKTSWLSQRHGLKGLCGHLVHCPQVTDEETETSETHPPRSCTGISNTGSTHGECQAPFLLPRGTGVRFSELGAMHSSKPLNC